MRRMIGYLPICLTVSLIPVLGMIIVAADRGSLPTWLLVLYSFPAGDKVGHMVLTGVLGFPLNLSLAARRLTIRGQRVFLGSVLLAVAVTLEEFSQLWFRHRTFSPLDLAFSYLGIWCGQYPALRIAAIVWRDRGSLEPARSNTSGILW